MAQRLTSGLAAVAVLLTAGPLAWTAPHDAGPDTSTAGEVDLIAGRITTVVIQTNPLQPIERQPLFLQRVPSYRRALALDGEQHWFEAAATYQQALIEVGHAAGLDDAPSWEQAAFRIDMERRRSQTLARAEARVSTTRGAAPRSQRPADLDRGRLLRLKLMSIRAATGAVPPGLASATLLALAAGLPGTARAESPRPSDDRSDPEVRLLLCATRAAIGDRAGARWELAHVAPSTRSAPPHALSLATCQAALGDTENAIGSLAVGVYRLGPSSRFLPGQTRELESANDWDPLRGDPRFERIFR